MRKRRIGLVQLCLLAVFVACGAAASADDSGAANSKAPVGGAAEAVLAPGEHLKPLEWLLGEWTGMTDNAVVLVSADWSDGGAFIERKIIVRPTGQAEVGGTQRIGWDPINRRIKCWTFDSQGGTGEGYWRRDGDNWIVESNEVLADGQTSSTNSVFTAIGKDRFTWQVERANVGGATLPTFKIEFVRAEEK